jgi:hypothetical protein
MSDYLKSTNFATKDALPSGNAGKIVKGTEIDNEFNAISDAVESKADLLNPVFSGLLTTDTLATGGAANIGGTLAVAGAFSAAADAQFTGTGRVKVPTGTTAQRPASPSAGSLRFNTTLGFLENYTGTEWRLVSPDPTPAQVSDQVNTSTGYFQVPKGNIAQRPVSPAEGLVRYNSESDIYEGYINGAWHRFVTVNQGSYTITYLVVSGGGGGGNSGGGGGGGGGGGAVQSTTSVVPGTTVLTMTIGAGGAANGTGTASLITGVATVGAGTGGANGPTGARGGGGTSGTGFGPGPYGGGGAAAAGSGSLGGNGLNSLITGVSTYWGGGGGGMDGDVANSYAGGLGGGGTGAINGSAGGTNTGGGGGGGSGGAAGQGGSGVIYLSMPTANYTGTHAGSPTITTSGSNTILRYTSSGSYTA